MAQRVIQQEGQSGKYYLDVAFRKLWFRLKYPEGKIVKKILKLTDQVAIVEARVYLNKNDAEENFIYRISTSLPLFSLNFYEIF